VGGSAAHAFNQCLPGLRQWQSTGRLNAWAENLPTTYKLRSR
jgi:hypothetical protein